MSCWLRSVLVSCAVALPAMGQGLPELYELSGLAGDQMGRAVAGVGDINGDGGEDMAVGMPGVGEALPAAEARVRLYSGKTGNSLGQVNGSLLTDGRTGAGPGSRFGWAVSGVGRVNADGVFDVVVGAPHSAPGDTGMAGIFSGADGSLLVFIEGLEPGDRFGEAVASISDMNDDGVNEVVVGAPGAAAGRGSAVIVSGATGDTIRVLGPGPLPADAAMGSSLARLADRDGDGRREWGAGIPGAAEVGIHDGATGDLVQRLTPPFSAQGGAGVGFGAAVANPGDVDGDGRDDILVGAPDAFGGIGAAWLFDADGQFLRLLRADTDAVGFGTAVAGTGDLDADGTPDLMVGAPGDGRQPGRVVTYSGSTGEELARVESEAPGDGLGTALAPLGDVLGDGARGLALGAPSASADAGLVRVVYAPGPSQQSALPEPDNALAGRPGLPGLVRLPLDDGGPGDDIAFGPLVIIPRSDGDSISAEFLEPDGMFSGFGEDFLVGEQPQQASSGDFDGDGEDDDYVTANGGDDSVTTSSGFGPGFAGTRVVVTPVSGNPSPVRVSVAEVDGNGRDDVLVAGATGISVLSGDGAGGFATVEIEPVPFATDLEVGDLDGDGDVDAAVASGALPESLSGGGAAGFATVLLGNGDGTFENAGTFGDGSPMASVQLGDVDDDGDLDVLTVRHAATVTPSARIDAWIGDGAGGFAPGPWPGAPFTSATGIHPTSGAVGDIDRDGRLDAVYTSAANIAFAPGTFDDVVPPLTVTVLRNLGGVDGAWDGFSVATKGTAYAGQGVEPILEDVFTDPDEPDATDPDLVLVWFVDELAGQSLVEQQTAFIALLVGNGDGGFVDPAPNQFATGDLPGDGDVADIGSSGSPDPGSGGPDGNPDLVIPSLLDNAVHVLFGNGAGGIASKAVLTDVDDLDPDVDLPPGVWSGGPRSARLAFLDADSVLDLVVYNEWQDAFLGLTVASLSLYRGAGNGTFCCKQYVSLPRGGEVALGELTGDGVPDVIVSQRGGEFPVDQVLLYVGTGLPGAGDPVVWDAPFPLDAPGRRFTGGLVAADVDGNGLDDVVTTSRDPTAGRGVILMFLNRGEGPVLAESPMTSDWQAVEGLAAGDVTGDGKPDALVGARDGRLVVAENVGPAQFAERPLTPAVAKVGGGSIAVGPVDGDAHLDIVSVKGNDAGTLGVHILSGDGHGAFTADLVPGVNAAGDSGARRPLLGDFDRDGTVDVVLSHGTSNTISILLSELGSIESVAPGVGGTGGIVPALTGLGYTTPGSIVLLTAAGAVGGAQGLLLGGTGLGEGLPAMETVLFSETIGLGGVPGAPGAGGPFFIASRLPRDPATVGTTFLVQFVFQDPAASGPVPGWSATNALALTLVD